MLNDENRAAVAAGVSLHWLKSKSKTPIGDDWNDKPTKSLEQLEPGDRNGRNIGIRPGRWSKTEAGYIHVIDLDINDEDYVDEALKALGEIAPGYESLPRVRSGSGGSSRHYYFVSPVPLTRKVVAVSDGVIKVGDKTKRHWQIEILGNCNCVLPPSIHPDTGKPYVWEVPFPWDELDLGVGPTVEIKFVEAYSGNSEKFSKDDPNYQEYAERNKPLEDFSPEKMKGILDDLPKWRLDDYDGWLEVGMAFHHQFRGSEMGFKIWCAWAKQSEKFVLRDAKSKWKSFGNRKNPKTFRSLIDEVKEIRFERQFPDLEELEDDFADEFDDCDGLLDVPVKTNLPAKVAKKDDNPIDRPVEQDKNKDWFTKLDKTDEGLIKSSLPNIELLLTHDPVIRGVIAYNAFTGDTIRIAKPLRRRKKPGSIHEVYNLDGPLWDVQEGYRSLWTDFHTSAVRSYLESKKSLGGRGMKVSDRDLESAINNVAQKNVVHPVKDMLENLPPWDGQHRVQNIFIKYLGAEDNAYHRETATVFMIAAIARIYEPGIKFDAAPILEGAQGIRKSTFIRELSMGFFGELSAAAIEDKKVFVEDMAGVWIAEIPELQGFNRSEVNDLKATMSRQSEKTRMAYGRRSMDFPRQNVMIGSTNEDEYLRDLTGGRRFWPIKCQVSSIDIDLLRKNLEQIWAEALAMYRELRERKPVGDLPLYIRDENAMEQALLLQDSRTVFTPEQDLLAEIEGELDRPKHDDFEKLEGDNSPDQYWDNVSIITIWTEILGRQIEHLNNQGRREIQNAMKLSKKWVRAAAPVWTGKKMERVYQRRK